jgi:hypothetical protein
MDTSVSDSILTMPTTASASPVLSAYLYRRITVPNDTVKLPKSQQRRDPEFVWIILFMLSSAIILTGCASSVSSIQSTQQTTSVTPSSLGIPNSIGTLGSYEFVSVQGTGEIFTYTIKNGKQVSIEPVYRTPCSDPSGMVLTNIAGNNVMAVVCYDTGVLLTLDIHADGSLSSLGLVRGLDTPYPGIALDGTNVLIPLFGETSAMNGGVAKVNIASPTNPVITGMATLASPSPGGYAHPGYLTVHGGYIFVSAGSESNPLDTSSTIQVVDETTMELVGSPFPVAHSPQQLAVQGTTAYVTMYDAVQLESIDISDPANLRSLQVLALETTSSCHAEPIVVRNSLAYVGCYAEGIIDEVDISNSSVMRLVRNIPGIAEPQRLQFAGNYLLVTSSTNGGNVYQIDIGPPN